MLVSNRVELWAGEDGVPRSTDGTIYISEFVGFADNVVLLDDRVDPLLCFNCVAVHGDTIIELVKIYTVGDERWQSGDDR